MRIVVTDLETWWDNEHTLSKMSPIEYCTSPKTEVISLGIKVGNYPTDVLFGEEAIAKALSKMDFSDSIVVGHNLSGFDAMILAWRFGVRPKMWGCTLAMARPIHAKTTGNSLEKLVAHYGLGVKDKTALVNTKGKRLKDFTPQELDAMREYNRSDVEQCRALFDILRKHYSAKELWLIDATIRMLVEPGFEVDTGLLETALTVERDHKRKLIYEVARLLRERGLSEERPEDFSAEFVEEHIRKDLASTAKFARVLEMLGVEVPTKPSPADPTKQIPALAKTDEGFLKLVEHKNELVAAAARARLSIKSTLLETRIEAFLRTAKALGGKLPAPLHYCGADTTGRWSGWAFNLQNLPRITPGKPKASDALRKSLRAPKGYKVVVADQSGIELRVNHFLWQVPESMELYNKDPQADLYRAFAAARYGVKPEEVTKEQRQLAKLCLAEGTLVLTKRGEIPIEQVTASDKVWDGVEWVSTLGAIYRGEKEVIEYDGLIATPDHEVWTDCGRKVPLWYAAAQSLRLARTGAGGVPLGFSGASNDGDLQNQEVQIRESTLRVVRNDKTDFIRQPESWEDTRVSVVQSEMRSTKMAFAAARSSQTEMYKPEGQGVRQIRRSGDSVQVQECSGSSRVGNGEFGPAQGQGVGQDRQQRPLRAGESSMGYTQAECGESEAVAIEAVPLVSGATSRDTLRGHHTSQLAIEGANVRADNREVEPPVGQTKRRVWDLLNCGPRNRFTANGRLVSNCQLGLGFGAGWKTFKRVAKLMGGLDLSDEEAEAVTTAWRTQYAEIVLGWRKCHAALTAIYAGEETEIDPWGLCKTTSEGIVLPSGRVIRYPALHQETNDEGKTEWWYGTGRHRARIYAGKVTENCLAEGTLVLTNSGWKPIEKVLISDLVHDGVEFVKHDGVVFKSVQHCIELDGVFLTPDHEVLTDDGWKEASQVQRPYRPDLRDVDCFTSCGVNGQNVEVALPMSLRKSGSQTWDGRDQGCQTRRDAELWVCDQTTNFQSQRHARYVEASGLRRLAVYAGSVYASISQSVAELRRAWHNCLLSLAGGFRELLGGHGAYVPTGLGFGQGGQRRTVFSGKLPLGTTTNQHHEQAGLDTSGGCSRAEPEVWHKSEHALLSTKARLGSGGLSERTITSKPVYDILNCGPRHRFVVKGDSGPIVVHNCVQALARDIIADNAVEFYKATGFRPALMVHDELVYIVPESQAKDALDELQKIMRTPPKWWPELVTWSEGDLADSYGDAK